MNKQLVAGYDIIKYHREMLPEVSVHRKIEMSIKNKHNTHRITLHDVSILKLTTERRKLPKIPRYFQIIYAIIST